MKKLLLAVISVIGLMVLLGGCSKKDEPNDYSLNGTVWVNNENGVRILKFEKETFSFDASYESEDRRQVREQGWGTYVYKPPFVFFSAINPSTGRIDTQTGKIDGNKLSFRNFIYTKQE
ncbi:hypothetical protein [Porphyromonas crevioricanis]|uniref:Lipoprotein n=1 Tax=Porphyromonas crevioricanis TaxID=393921 RepID=A0A2X4PWC1_9PORP|nr:hypothetical protein [Porphyromonas crevioricanis]SQH72789.1 Uncharacterised protein [Porphyromonas crevioricanis]